MLPSSFVEKPEEAQKVEFAFSANYPEVINEEFTKTEFISSLRTLLANLLNISEARITNIDIRSGSIIVTFSIRPSSNSIEASVNSTLLALERLVKTSSINFTLPGSNESLRVDPNSFKIVSSTTVIPTTILDGGDPGDDDLSKGEIAMIVIICLVVAIAVIVAIVYYIVRVRPNRAGKISPHGSHVQLNEQQGNSGEHGALNNHTGETGLCDF